MPAKALVTQSKVLEPIIGSRVDVYRALQTIKTRHGAIKAVEYPHEVSRGVWRTVVAVPNTTPRKTTVRKGLTITIRPRTAGYVALGLTAAGMLGLGVWAVVTIVAWVIGHLAIIIGSAAVLVVLSGFLVGRRACVHADHH